MNTDQHELDRLIDLLVDDELDTGARRDLFARLDVEPGGWRRCACAFLEAQSWHSAIAPLAPETPSLQPRSAKPWRPVLGFAAGLLLAFTLGWAARREMPAVGHDLAAVPAGLKSGSANDPDVPRHAANAVGSGALAHPDATLHTATVSQDRRFASPLPESVRRRLEQRGFEIEQQQKLLAVGLENGRSVTIPVDELKVRYVGKRTL